MPTCNTNNHHCWLTKTNQFRCGSKYTAELNQSYLFNITSHTSIFSEKHSTELPLFIKDKHICIWIFQFICCQLWRKWNFYANHRWLDYDSRNHLSIISTPLVFIAFNFVNCLQISKPCGMVKVQELHFTRVWRIFPSLKVNVWHYCIKDPKDKDKPYASNDHIILPPK